MPTDTLTMTAATPQAITDARHTLEAQLTTWACGRTADSLLVFSELVTNAVRHAGGAQRITIVHGDRTLRLEIHDHTRGIPAVAAVAGSAGGFGLRIVEQLSQTWGWTTTDTGKIVWADLECCTHPRL